MATWQLKDLRRWSEKHPLEGAKISTEQNYPFSWEIPSLKLELNNFEGTFDSMARGDEVIIYNKQGDEIRFAGIVDNIKRMPKNYYLEVFVLNYGIQLKDCLPYGQFETDDEGEYTHNVITSVNGVPINKALSNTLFETNFNEIGGTRHVRRLFVPDFASADAFSNTPYSRYGTTAHYIMKQLDGEYFRIPQIKSGVRTDLESNLYQKDGKLYFIVQYIYPSGNTANYGYKIYEINTNTNTITFKDTLDGYTEKDADIPYNMLPDMNETYPDGLYQEMYDDYRDIYGYNVGSPPIEIQGLKDFKGKPFFIIREVWENVIWGGATLTAYNWSVGRFDSALNSIHYRYTNPKCIDIVRDMAILSNGLWWVTKEMNKSLPTLHFYPREAVYTTVDIAPWRSKIIDIQEETIYRSFDKEISDSVILSDILKGNIRKYYQEQSGEYIKTKIEFFAREIGDTFGITIMADVMYNNYTIGQAVTFDFVDENTTIVMCMKKNENYRKWYR